MAPYPFPTVEWHQIHDDAAIAIVANSATSAIDEVISDGYYIFAIEELREYEHFWPNFEDFQLLIRNRGKSWGKWSAECERMFPECTPQTYIAPELHNQGFLRQKLITAFVEPIAVSFKDCVEEHNTFIRTTGRAVKIKKFFGPEKWLAIFHRKIDALLDASEELDKKQIALAIRALLQFIEDVRKHDNQQWEYKWMR